jgi:hypothetical protein
VFGGAPVSRLRGQAVVKPLLPDLDSFLPQAASSRALKIGGRGGGMAPRRRGQRARASAPFRLKIMFPMMA